MFKLVSLNRHFIFMLVTSEFFFRNYSLSVSWKGEESCFYFIYQIRISFNHLYQEMLSANERTVIHHWISVFMLISWLFHYYAYQRICHGLFCKTDKFWGKVNQKECYWFHQCWATFCQLKVWLKNHKAIIWGHPADAFRRSVYSLYWCFSFVCCLTFLGWLLEVETYTNSISSIMKLSLRLL